MRSSGTRSRLTPDIADIANGANALVQVKRLQLFTHVMYIQIDSRFARFCIVSPKAIRNSLARENFTLMQQEIFEQIEFFVCQNKWRILIHGLFGCWIKHEITTSHGHISANIAIASKQRPQTG